MPFSMKIQPVDFNAPNEYPKFEPVTLRFKRLFERQFLSVLSKPVGASTDRCRSGTDSKEFEPSSVCLEKMVRNFMEESHEMPHQKSSRNACNCLDESDDEELESCNCFGESYSSSSSSPSPDARDIFKVVSELIPCLGVSERNLLANTAKIIDKNKNISGHKNELCRKIVTDGLLALGYDASICKSKWERSPSIPAGEFEYVDVNIEDGERMIIDIDFRSQFETARPTKSYKLVLQTLPTIFVGKSDRLEQIISIVSEAAKQSLKKKGMSFPPWRKTDYMKAKWLSPHIRTNSVAVDSTRNKVNDQEKDYCANAVQLRCSAMRNIENGDGCMFVLSKTDKSSEEECMTPLVKQWEPPLIRPKNFHKGVKIVTGLASVMEDKL